MVTKNLQDGAKVKHKMKTHCKLPENMVANVLRRSWRNYRMKKDELPQKLMRKDKLTKVMKTTKVMQVTKVAKKALLKVTKVTKVTKATKVTKVSKKVMEKG